MITLPKLPRGISKPERRSQTTKPGRTVNPGRALLARIRTPFVIHDGRNTYGKVLSINSDDNVIKLTAAAPEEAAAPAPAPAAPTAAAPAPAPAAAAKMLPECAGPNKYRRKSNTPKALKEVAKSRTPGGVLSKVDQGRVRQKQTPWPFSHSTLARKTVSVFSRRGRKQGTGRRQGVLRYTLSNMRKSGKPPIHRYVILFSTRNVPTTRDSDCRLHSQETHDRPEYALWLQLHQ